MRSRHENHVWVFYINMHTHTILIRKPDKRINVHRGYVGMLILTKPEVEWT